MALEWAPSLWGQHLTRSSDWRLCLANLRLVLTLDGLSHETSIEDESTYSVHAGVFWTDITLFPGQIREVKVDGLPNAQGEALSNALKVALTEKRLQEDLAFLLRTQHTIDTWLDHKMEQERVCTEQRRWFTQEQQDAVIKARPTLDLAALRSNLRKPNVAGRLGQTTQAIERSLTAWEADYRPAWAALNAAHVERELVACKEFLDGVESKPLTLEQARAVVCFDNRVQVVASAGSGKTSTIVAKAAYALHRGLVSPNRIVLLTFNKQAAEELKERMAKALERTGLAGVSVETSTFHALGLGLIGKATGAKPNIPDWATNPAGGVRKLTEIVDHLKDSSHAFRRQWDLFRFVFGRDLPAFGAQEPADVWDATGKGLLVTNRGERVKSQEEVMIANFLFLNGIDYRYESPYPHRTATETHRQYVPDFYYPDLNLFHEHFALDAQGMPPAHFEDYLEGVQWKRQLHAEQGTALFETTSHGLRNGSDFDRLERELTSRGLVLDPNPDRQIPKYGEQPMESSQLIGLVRTFISHTKSNALSVLDLQKRLDTMPPGAFKLRYHAFMNIVEPILSAWDEALAAEEGIDFEDMLNLAADHLERRHVESPYDLVMADEFQDASRARARLCRALVQEPGRFFFAVGDDWQSINRFAGADVSVMTGFQEWFGSGQLLKLEQTFRCPQALCDVSSAFISKNPAQMTKRVHSATPAQGPVIRGFQVNSTNELADAIDRFILDLAEGVRNGSILPGRNGKVSVYMLGRYNVDRQYMPMKPGRFNRWVEVSFMTIHRSKGSEADFVILPEMISAHRRRGFPNTSTDDPVLSLAMPTGDSFPLGEERRLFYVALTRARRTVVMFTVRGKSSSFLKELKEDGAVAVTGTSGEAIEELACPACKQGVLVVRVGPYGEFCSCSNFPLCSYKPQRSGGQPSRTSAQSAPPRSAPAALSPSAPAEPPSPQFHSPKPRLFSILQSVKYGLEEINRSVSQASALQAATADLNRQLFAERTIIERALKMAKSAIDLEEHMKDPEFKNAYERIKSTSVTQSGSKGVASHSRETPLPNFERNQAHSDDEFDEAIQREFDRLREERESFLSAVHDHLSGDTVLHGHFLASLKKLDSERYRTALDPDSSWTRR